MLHQLMLCQVLPPGPELFPPTTVAFDKHSGLPVDVSDFAFDNALPRRRIVYAGVLGVVPASADAGP